MRYTENRPIIRWFIIIISFGLTMVILWNTYLFFQYFKEEERHKMEYWAQAQKTINEADMNTDIDLPFKILENATIPIILVQDRKILKTANIDESITNNPEALYQYWEKLKGENEPISIAWDEGKFQYLYYGNSPLINTLKYYPIALLLIIFLFAGLIFNYYQSTKMATQNKLWAGMAKETAHQIGTPLSSLLGWLEWMKADQYNPEAVVEIEKDIQRLQTITDRFSKIGSEPKLEKHDLILETEQSYDYLKRRYAGQIEFNFSAPNYPVFVQLNAVLHSWTIENLVKNAIDAMKGRGKLTIEIIDDPLKVIILVHDTGKGIPKKMLNKIFEPGYTSKKRGWGLGLSLTRRIVEEYHKGRIEVAHSELNKGTTFRLVFPKIIDTSLFG
jgi:signal transduction histidine kinase